MQVSKQPTALAQQECKLLLVAAALPSYREYWPRRAALKLQPPQGCLVCYRPLASQSSAGLLNALDVQISLCQMYMIYTAKLIFVARPHLEGRGQNLEPSPSTEKPPLHWRGAFTLEALRPRGRRILGQIRFLPMSGCANLRAWSTRAWRVSQTGRLIRPFSRLGARSVDVDDTTEVPGPGYGLRDDGG